MIFAYDNKKSLANKVKHGITLEEAKSTSKRKKIKAADFDVAFDKGEVTEQHL